MQALENGTSLQEALALDSVIPASIALQPRDTRDELPNLSYSTSIELSAENPIESYDPLKHNSAFNKLIDFILSGASSEPSMLERQYVEAIKADVLLLTGIQSIPLLKMIQGLDPKIRQRAWIAIAFTGDTGRVSELEVIRDGEAEVSVRRWANWALNYLQQTGEDLSLSNSIQYKELWENRQRIVAFPNRAKSILVISGVTETPWTSHAFNAVFRLATENLEYRPFPLVAQASRFIRYTNLGSGQNAFMADLNFGIYLKDKGLLEEALSITTMLLNADDSNMLGRAQNAHGYILYLMKRYDEALPHFQASIEAGRLDGWPERNIAETYAELGLMNKAHQYHELAIAKVGKLRSELEQRFATGALEQEQYENFTHTASSELAGFLNAYSWFLVTLENASTTDMNKALELSKKSNDLSSYSDPRYLDTLAHAYARLGQFKNAVELERKALSFLTENDTKSMVEYKRVLRDWEQKLQE